MTAGFFVSRHRENSMDKEPVIARVVVEFLEDGDASLTYEVPGDLVEEMADSLDEAKKHLLELSGPPPRLN